MSAPDRGPTRTFLVTGGAGFIGSHLVDRLLSAGADVAVVDDLTNGRRELLHPGATFERLDVRDGAIAAVIEEHAPDVVVHLAALHFVPYCLDNPEETFDVNVIGTRNVLGGIERAGGVERVLYASSAAVYPPRSGPLSEQLEPGPTDVYGRTKLVGEDLAERFALRTGVPTVTARLFNVYGLNDTNPHVIPEIVRQLSEEGRPLRLGNLSPERDFVHVHDVVRALLLLATDISDGYDVYNVGTGRARSVREVAELAIEIAGDDRDIARKDRRVRETDRPHLRADVSKLKESVGWHPEIGLRRGLDELIDRR